MAERLLATRLGGGGDGIADGPDGPAHLSGILPGETALAERDGRTWRVVGRDGAAPDRIDPFCPYYGRCGGCVAQHVGPDLYGAWKRDKVETALRRAGRAVAVEPLRDGHGAGRRRVTFHAREIDGAVRVGFMAAGSHDLVPIERCPITVDALAPAAPVAERLATLLRSSGKPIDIAVTATDGGLDVDLRGTGPLSESRRQILIGEAGRLGLARLTLHGEVLVAPGEPAVAVGPGRVILPPGSFLQATAAGETVLAGLVEEGCAGAKRIADLFCGVGPFALRLAARAEILAVDGDAAALAALDRAARAVPGLRPIATERRDLFRRPLLPLDLAGYDAAVLDPPRAGCEAQARQVAASALGRVVMVSCDPGTFARDVAILAEAGFAAERVVPVDQFRWSAHVEIVGTFVRRVAKTRHRR